MFKNIVWDFAGKFSIQIIGFGISVILTRLLNPAQFGVMGMGMAIIVFAHIFLDLGFNRAIIQFKEISEEQYSTIFFLNTCVAALLTIICFFTAEPLAAFYGQPLIAPVFKVLSLLFLINGVNLVPASLLYKRLQFKLNSILTLIASVSSGIVGIIMAYNGFGVWSLVIQSLINAFLTLALNFIYAKWLPIFKFDLPAIRPLWRYGSKLFASGLLDNFYTRLDIFIIGKIFSVSTLGYYTRAQSMDSFVRQISVNSIMGALFPYIAKHQDDRPFLADLYKRYLHIITFVAIALSGTLFLCAKYIFLILFTSKWLYAADLFKLMSVIGFVWPVSSIMCNIIAGVGNSSAFFRLEIIKKTLFLPVYVLGFYYGLTGFLYFFIAANFMALTINAWYVKKEIAVPVAKQLLIMFSYFIIAAFAAGAAYLLYNQFGPLNNWWSVISLAAFFNLFYLTTCFILRLDAFKSMEMVYKKLKQFLYDKRNKNVPPAI